MLDVMIIKIMKDLYSREKAEAALKDYLAIRDMIVSAGVPNLFVNLNGNS